MTDNSNWKFYLTLFVSLFVGVAIPVWIWRADLRSQSMSVRIVSQTALQPELPVKMGGIQLTVDGQPLNQPYLTVIQLGNDGARALRASDYESPLEIRATGKAKIVRLQVTQTNPRNLEPKVLSEANAIKLRPLLLNPGDSITLAVATANGIPFFETRARISGIDRVDIDAVENKPGAPRQKWLGALISFCLLMTYAIVMPAAFLGRTERVGRAIMFIGGVASAGGAALIAKPLLLDLNFSPWQELLALSVFSLTAFGTAILLNSRHRNRLQRRRVI